MFWFLLVAGRVNLYLSARTSWVVPVGAVILSVATAGIVLSARRSAREPLRRKHALLAAALILPVIMITASPPTVLGSFSAARKVQYSGGGLYTRFGTFRADSEITMLFAAASQFDADASALLAGRAGSEVRFVGFVQHYPSTPPDEFMLTRLVATCCVADTVVVAIRVVGAPGSYATDEWVEVEGTIYPVGGQVIVQASSVVQVPLPEDPYLTP
jgi:uncharacterized repeat protein (TIGR03943 family)